MARNSAGREYNLWYVHNQDTHAAGWLGKYTKGQDHIYSGSWPGPRVLEIQGMIDRNRTFTGREIPLADFGTPPVYTEIFVDKSKIYTTNGSAVYR